MAHVNPSIVLRTPLKISNCVLLWSLPILVSLLLMVSPTILRALESSLPQFEDYTVKEIYTGVPRKINFGTAPKARQFKTVVKTGLQEGKANFAGHYRIVQWGCGSSCQVFALIDMKNGNVYFPDFSTGLGMEYRINSSLLITDPPKEILEYYGGELPNDGSQLFYSSYYRWDERSKELVTLLDGYKKKDVSELDKSKK